MVQNNSTTEEQERIGYGCSCGFTTPDISPQSTKDFTTHVMRSALRDGKGTHKSIGQLNLKTREIVTPPWGDLKPEAKKDYFQRYHGKKKDEGEGGQQGKKLQATTVLSQAQQIRLVPKVFTMDYTPIMRAAQDAAARFFGWRPDMPLENFIDTCLYYFFFEKGITLCGYVVHESLLKKEGQPDAS